MAEKGQKFKLYDLETKAETIRLEEGLSYCHICERLGFGANLRSVTGFNVMKKESP